MPISRNNRLYCTAEQYAAAKKNNNALEYVRRRGYALIQEGKYYRLRDHDSLVFAPDGTWWWNSRGLHGNDALEFLIRCEGRSFPEAVLILAGDHPEDRSGLAAEPVSSAPIPAPVVPFKLPPCSSDMRRMVAYLCKTRKLAYALVQEMLDQGLVYESVYRTTCGTEIHNACFVSYDARGIPVSAYQRGITADSTYKGEVPGSSKDWGWLLSGKHPTTLYIFEAVIDAASFATLRLRQGEDPLDDGDYLALGGLSLIPIQHYLDTHPHIEEITLLLDGDAWGKAAAQRCQEKLEKLGYRVSSRIPPYGKDWNDTLIAASQNQ